MKKILILIILQIVSQYNFAQIAKKDSLNYRFLLVASGIYATSVTGLSLVWYQKFNHTKFHLFNDGPEWLQMDKVGHGFSAFYMNRILHENLRENNLLLSTATTQIYLLGIELLDATQADWGFSIWDEIADLSGSLLYIASSRYGITVTPKFFYNPTIFPQYAPNLLGHNFAENILKDYNGQSYWLAFDIPGTKFLTIDFGYSANGMIGGRTNPSNFLFTRTRQFYLSPGINLTKIPTQKKWLQQLFKILNIIKIPLPAVGISSDGQWLIKFANY